MNILRRLLHPAQSPTLKSKLFVLLAAISIIPSLVVYASSQLYMFRANTQYSASISNQYLQSVSLQLASYLEGLVHSFDPLIVDYDFQQYVQASREDYGTQARLLSTFRTSIDNVLQSRGPLTGVLYLDRQGKVFYESYKHSLNFSYSFEKDSYYSTVIGTDSVNLSYPHPASYMLGRPVEVVTLAIPVLDLRSGSYESWLLLEIEADYIRGQLNEDLSAQSGSHLLLYDRGTRSFIATRRFEEPLLHQLQDSLQSAASEGAPILFQASGDRFEATYRSLSIGEWDLVWVASLNELTGGTKRSLRIMVTVAVLSLIVALLIAYPVMRVVFRPLTHLNRSIKNLSTGIYLPVKAARNPNDEIGYLVHTFNKMLVDLKQLEREVLDSRLREKERELLQLQAQIHPHFLFNTLETIESYALQNNPEAVGVMVQNVSRMMRYNVRNDGGWATLEEELDYIRQYLSIHAYRTGAEIDVEWAVDPNCLHRSVMKLSIQPFVENALKYAWNPNREPPFRLRIQVQSTEKELLFSVADNGEGASEGVRDKIARMEERSRMEDDPYFRAHTGIYNVYRRFFLAYGDRVRIEMVPNIPRGTVVRWAIPDEGVTGSDTFLEAFRTPF